MFITRRLDYVGTLSQVRHVLIIPDPKGSSRQMQYDVITYTLTHVVQVTDVTHITECTYNMWPTKPCLQSTKPTMNCTPHSHYVQLMWFTSTMHF